MLGTDLAPALVVMSTLAPLESLLQHYRQLAFHQNPALAQRLILIQDWQKQRMQHTHAPLFERYPDMAAYFLNRLYGGADFDVLAEQLQRVVSKAQKVEKLVPESTVKTGMLGIELAVLAIELDEQVARWWQQEHPDQSQPDDALMLEAYQALQQDQARLRQMDLLDQLGVKLDQYVRSFVVQSVFKLARGAAQKHQLGDLYQFTSEGFAAMKPLKNAKDFVGRFTAAERDTIHRVHSGHADPFLRG